MTSVVQKTPVKDAAPEVTEECPNGLVESSASETSSDESEGEPSSPVSKTPSTKLFSNISAPGKRSAKDSPEVSSENSKRDKKKKKKDNKSASANLRSSSRQTLNKK